MNKAKMSMCLGRLPSCALKTISVATLLAVFGCSNIYAQQDVEKDVEESGLVLEELVVVARQRSELIQDVPDSLTVFSVDKIESAGIDDVSDFVRLTPNITYREAFRAGVTFITIRGITTGQQGWAPVTYVVDGVPAASLDAINQGALTEIERIEVLKGPQSALYGAGAIAGAINVVTKKPTDEFDMGVNLSYASGNDLKAGLSLSGPMSDNVYYRLDGYVRNSDGVIESTDGDGLDFDEQKGLRGRLIFDYDNFEIDLRAHLSDIKAGAAFQELLPAGDVGFQLLDNFDDSPGIRRGIIGSEDRKFKEASMKLSWEMSGGTTFTSISSYSDLDQGLFGSTSWQKPPAAGFCGPVGGEGQAPDCFQVLGDDVEAVTQDVRLTSSSDNSFRWIIGASYLDRQVVNLLRVGAAGLSSTGVVVEGDSPFLNRIDLRKDRFTGVYGQMNYDLSDNLELTLAGRYDKNDYETTQYTGLDLETPVPTPAGVVTQQVQDSSFQPKVQLSYDWSDDLMTYLTVARGFRTGFFNTGNRAGAENTLNYELGFKSTILGGRGFMNGALFRINYSDQQFSRIIPEPPFLSVNNIPETDINGFELESVIQATDNLGLNFGIGYTDAEVQDGFSAPFTPKLTGNIGLDYSAQFSEQWEWEGRFDYRYQSSQYLERNEQFEIGAKNYLGARLSLLNEHWRFTLFVENLMDERQANEINNVGFGYIRVPNKPRVIGVSMSYQY